MLDLKAQLLGAGIVSEDQVKKVEEQQAKEREERRKRRQARKEGKPFPGKGKGAKGGGPKGKGPKGDGKKGPVIGPDGKKKWPKKGPKPDDKKGGKSATSDVDADRWRKRIAELAEAGKSEQYDVVRNWVRRTRLDDAKALPTETAERFHFTKYDGQISWFTIEPDMAEKLKNREAGIMAYMGYNGLEHCIAPVDVVQDVSNVRPEWVRHLEGWTPRSKEEDDKLAAEEEAKKAAEAEANGETVEAKAEGNDDGEPQAEAAPEAEAKTGESAPAEEAKTDDA